MLHNQTSQRFRGTEAAAGMDTIQAMALNYAYAKMLSLTKTAARSSDLATLSRLLLLLRDAFAGLRGEEQRR